MGLEYSGFGVLSHIWFELAGRCLVGVEKVSLAFRDPSRGSSPCVPPVFRDGNGAGSIKLYLRAEGVGLASFRNCERDSSGYLIFGDWPEFGGYDGSELGAFS